MFMQVFANQFVNVIVCSELKSCSNAMLSCTTILSGCCTGCHAGCYVFCHRVNMVNFKL